MTNVINLVLNVLMEFMKLIEFRILLIEMNLENNINQINTILVLSVCEGNMVIQLIFFIGR